MIVNNLFQLAINYLSISQLIYNIISSNTRQHFFIYFMKCCIQAIVIMFDVFNSKFIFLFSNSYPHLVIETRLQEFH